MNTMKHKALRLPALALAAALAMPALAAAGPQPLGENTAQILVRTPGRTRVVMGRAGHGYLGVQLMDITEELREFYGAPRDAGVLVSRVGEDSPAAAAGFEVGDVITAVGGESTENSWDVVRSVAQFEPEEQVSLEVIRDGAPLTLTATLGEREGGVWFGRGDGPELQEFHFEMPDLERLDVLREVRGALTEDTREAVREAIQAARERMSEFDYEALQERLAATEARLRELEQKLAERER